MKFSAYKKILRSNKKQKELMERNKNDDKYRDYPKILIETLKEIDSVAERHYSYTEYQYFKEDFQTEFEKRSLVQFSGRQSVYVV